MTKPVLAIEWSSTRLSIARMQGEHLEENVLELKRFQAELVLPVLETFLSEMETPSQIRIGRGPGNYSGIRQALAWAFGYCAPGGIDLKVYSSGVAQAARISHTRSCRFAVLGDARRGVWWGRVFGEGGEDWKLQSPEQWAVELGSIPVYSQEALRLAQAPFEVIADFPTALDLLNLSEDLPTEEPAPLYLHPAV